MKGLLECPDCRGTGTTLSGARCDRRVFPVPPRMAARCVPAAAICPVVRLKDAA